MVRAPDLDLELKLRFRRILFHERFWSPIEVELSQYESGAESMKRRSLTDLDVLGIRYDSLFTPFKVVADCKTGRNVSDVNRLFWLKGIKDYFGADEAYYIRPVLNAQTRTIAPKLGLRTLDGARLSGLEETLRVRDLAIPSTDPSQQQLTQSLWGIKVPEGTKPSDSQLALKKVYSYLSYSYWYIEQYRNLLSLVDQFSGVAAVLRPDDPAHTLLAFTGLERFAHSLLEMAASVVAQGASNVPLLSRGYVFGGPLSLREKEAFFQLLRKLTKANEQLEPPYFHDIVELLARLLSNPNGAADVLRHISAVYAWCVDLGNTTLLPLDGTAHNTAAVVLARDAANSFAKATGLNSGLFHALLSL